MSSAVGSAVGDVQNKTSNIAAGQFNSYDSFDATSFGRSLRSLPAPRSNRDTKTVFKIKRY